jgi:tRNA modification GTPase
MANTIVALASGAGRAGVAVIRMSGPATKELLEGLTGPAPEPRRASIRRIVGPDGALIDEALVLWFPGPGSFTGEDVAEFQVHGGPAIVEAVLKAVLATGQCRLAEPGEFTRRAFQSGRIDLLQAEAVADLVDAETAGQAAQAARLYEGEAARCYEGWREALITAMAALEAAIDFPDEADIPGEIARRAVDPIGRLVGELEAALGAADRHEAVRDGFRIAILGPPNAGKSSLLNCLAGREAAIVSDIPGTTRDVVEVRLVLGGFPVWVADTAGLREAADQIEAEGVRRALLRAEDADLRIWVSEAGSGPRGVPQAPPDSASDSEFWGAAGVSRETLRRRGADLRVLNKADLAPPGMAASEGDHVISARTGSGIEALISDLTARIQTALISTEPPLITRARHRLLVSEALDHCRRALDGADRMRAAELVSEDLRLAARALGRVTGRVDVEDLLDRIFSQFCIGK